MKLFVADAGPWERKKARVPHKCGRCGKRVPKGGRYWKRMAYEKLYRICNACYEKEHAK